MLTRYGTDNIVVMLIVAIILIALSFIIPKGWYTYVIGLLGITLAVFTLWFFRDPERKVPDEALRNESLIISPADGEVLEVVEEDEPVFIKDKVTRISIFLSPFDVHVNRYPVSGRIEYFQYNPGKYLVAYHPKSSVLNEQTHIGIENKYGKVFFKQITGIVARRLVWDCKAGDSAVVGKRFGMMKFGSRMDIMVRTGSEILINVGDRVIAGETMIAKLNTANAL